MEISRREFLKLSGGLGLALALPNLDSAGAVEVPQMGDVIQIGGEAYLLRSNKAFLIPDLEKYKKYTKFSRFGRKIYSQGSEILSQYPPIRLKPTLLTPDPVTGDLKNTMPYGGEMVDFYSGIFTSEGLPYNPIYPTIDTFKNIINRLVERKSFKKGDFLIYNHGVGKFESFSPADTLRPPKENIEFALSRAEKIKNDFPLVQINAIGHSFGGVIALEVARNHPDLINNLILINSPVRGIEWNPLRGILRRTVKPMIHPFVGEEYVTEYLFQRWQDRNFQQQLLEFARDFTGRGRKLTVVVAENDPIVPKESTIIPGALTITLTVGDPRLNITDYPKEHGLPLKYDRVVDLITTEVGDSLANLI